MNQPFNGSTNQWTSESTNQWINESMVGRFSESVGQWLDGSMKQPISESLSQWSNEPMSQWFEGLLSQWIINDSSTISWISESMSQKNQWISESKSLWITDSRNQWINDSTVQWANDSISQWTNGSMHQWINWINGSTIQWVKESLNQWTKEAMNKWILPTSSSKNASLSIFAILKCKAIASKCANRALATVCAHFANVIFHNCSDPLNCMRFRCANRALTRNVHILPTLSSKTAPKSHGFSTCRTANRILATVPCTFRRQLCQIEARNRGNRNPIHWQPQEARYLKKHMVSRPRMFSPVNSRVPELFPSQPLDDGWLKWWCG